MKRIFLFLILLPLLFYFLCELPQDPRLDYNRSRIDVTIDTIDYKDKKVEKFVGDTINFGFHPHLPNLIDSFSVNLGDDTLITFSVDKQKSKDTIKIAFSFLRPGEKILSIEMFFTNKTSRKIDSIVIFNIINVKPKFVPNKPDSIYTIRDGTQLNIPLQAEDTQKDTVILRLGKIDMPPNSKVEIVKDSFISLSVPTNVDGKYKIEVIASDGIDSVKDIITIVILDSTPPFPPIFSSPLTVNSSTPIWHWKSGGNGGCGIFRVSLDDINIAARGVEINSTEYQHPSSLPEGKHTLFLQERDISGNWSNVSFWEIIIDLTPPDAPIVTGISPTNNMRPTWSWSGSGSPTAVFRYKLNSLNFTDADTFKTDSTSFTPPYNLTEGAHTLYVQELDDVGNWSKSGSFTIIIDITGPNPPTLMEKPQLQTEDLNGIGSLMVEERIFLDVLLIKMISTRTLFIQQQQDIFLSLH